MARPARSEVFDPDQVGVYHVYNRVVRRCFLWGVDPISGIDFCYRREMVVERLRMLAQYFAIDVLGYAVLSNHFHLVVRNRPDLVEQMSDRDVAWRWLMICPEKRNPDQTPVEPTEKQLQAVLGDKKKVKEFRTRLSNPSWLMARACQYIARRCNKEDEQSGRFFEERFKMKRLLDDAAVLACLAYVDLNPTRAGMSEQLDGYEAVSISERMRQLDDSAIKPHEWLVPFMRSPDSEPSAAESDGADASPAVETTGSSQPVVESLGCLPIHFDAYVRLLRWLIECDRAKRDDSGVVEDHQVSGVLGQLGLEADGFAAAVGQYEGQFCTVVGCSASVERERHRRCRTRLHVPGRVLLDPAPT